jgi:hypothetical protein
VRTRGEDRVRVLALVGKSAVAALLGISIFAAPARADGWEPADGWDHGKILPWLDLPPNILAGCSAKVMPGQCFEDGMEEWNIKMPYADALPWVRGQVAKVGWPEKSNVGEDALLWPSTSWRNGQFLVVISSMEPMRPDYYSILKIVDCLKQKWCLT